MNEHELSNKFRADMENALHQNRSLTMIAQTIWELTKSYADARESKEIAELINDHGQALKDLNTANELLQLDVKAERERNAALVAALEDMYLAYGTTVKIGQLNGLRTVQTNIGRDIKHALAANEKGGAND